MEVVPAARRRRNLLSPSARRHPKHRPPARIAADRDPLGLAPGAVDLSRDCRTRDPTTGPASPAAGEGERTRRCRPTPPNRAPLRICLIARGGAPRRAGAKPGTPAEAAPRARARRWHRPERPHRRAPPGCRPACPPRSRPASNPHHPQHPDRCAAEPPRPARVAPIADPDRPYGLRAAGGPSGTPMDFPRPTPARGVL